MKNNEQNPAALREELTDKEKYVREEKYGKHLLRQYLKEIYETYARGDAQESSYYSHLEKLLSGMSKIMEDRDIQITINPKQTEGCSPDFCIWGKESNIIGCVEAKNPGIPLEKVEESEQVERYKEKFHKLLLTNFLEFRLYLNDFPMNKVSVGNPSTLAPAGGPPTVRNDELFYIMLEEFFSSTPIRRLNFPLPKFVRELARRTRSLRDQVITGELEKCSDEKSNPILGFYDAFREQLMESLTKKDFADLYSQTVTFGLFMARSRCKEKFKREDAAKFIPRSLGILHDVFKFISADDISPRMKTIIDGIANYLDSAEIGAILGKTSLKVKVKVNVNDPFIHFYETFLNEYDPETRGKRGVYYTPRPVVIYIVSAINVILKKKLNRPDGLADLKIKILDPAAGTMTFVAEAADMAVKEFIKKYGAGTKSSIVRGHLLKNFYAFELMMAPYVVGHLKMSYLFNEMGVPLTGDRRFKLYLTNALDMKEIEQANLPGISTLSEENRKANRIKKESPVMVVLGNPPYSMNSENVGEWVSEAIKEYYNVDGKPLGEKNPKWLRDDYVKFIRFGQWKIDRNGEGVMGFITNHSYLDNPTFRGMRYSLMKSFNEIYILDLHGNTLKKEKCPDGSRDENVFDIRQGTGIGLFVKKRDDRTPCKVFYHELWGSRWTKYDELDVKGFSKIAWKEIHPRPNFYLFVPRDNRLEGNYKKFFNVSEIFPVNSVGVITARDKLTIKWKPEEVKETISRFSGMETEEARLFFDLGPDARDWKVALARKDIVESGLKQENIVPILYRPFDTRYTYYTGNSRGFHCMPRGRVMQNMKKTNLGLITNRFVNGGFRHVLCTDVIISDCAVSLETRERSYLFPLYIYASPDKKSLFSNTGDRGSPSNTPNINRKLYDLIRGAFPGHSISPEDIFYYIYAILYSTIYREKYSEHLKTDFPRIPFTSNSELFIEMGELGHGLVDIHLMMSPELDPPSSTFDVEEKDNDVKKVKYNENEKRVYINDRQYFSKIDKDIWEYYIGGYRVMEKWLKSRKNRTLSAGEIKHYIRIARALRLTIRYQEKIDDLYNRVEENLIEQKSR